MYSGYGGYPGGPGDSAGYAGGYPAPPGPPQVNQDVQRWFDTVDTDRSGKINQEELKAALVNGQGKNFSDAACKLMIGMFDKDQDGTINLQEFQQLFDYINQWLAVFRVYDRDQSGHIEESELYQAFQQMGYRFSPQFIQFLVAKSDLENHKQISVDQFIVICIQIQRFTEAFRAKDSQQNGTITIGFEEFLTIALNCSI